LILSTDDGTKKGLGFILGWLTSLVLVVAVVVLITGARPVRFRTFPSTVVLTIKPALGIALIVLAAVEWQRRNRAHRTPAWLARLDTMSPWAAAVIAAIMQPWTLVAAAAVTAAQARISSAGDYLALASFCLLATSSFIVLELYAVFASAASTATDSGCLVTELWADHRGALMTGISPVITGTEGPGQAQPGNDDRDPGMARRRAREDLTARR
jgi:Sap, sulfolipid-1-addressing protein